MFLPRFQRPGLAKILVVLAAMALVFGLVPLGHIEKFGFALCMGMGTGYLMSGAKALLAEHSNLAVLVAILGVSMILVGGLATPPSVLAASALEDFAPVIIGGALGYFSRIEEG